MLVFRARACAYQGARNDSFLENFAYVLNQWSPCKRLVSQSELNIRVAFCIKLGKSWQG